MIIEALDGKGQVIKETRQVIEGCQPYGQEFGIEVGQTVRFADFSLIRQPETRRDMSMGGRQLKGVKVINFDVSAIVEHPDKVLNLSFSVGAGAYLNSVRDIGERKFYFKEWWK